MSRGRLPAWQPTEARAKAPLACDTDPTGPQAPLQAHAASSSSRVQTDSVVPPEEHQVTCRPQSHASPPNCVTVAMTSSWRSDKSMPTVADADSKASEAGRGRVTVVVAQHIGMRGLASVVAALGTGQRRVQSPMKFAKRIPRVSAQVWDDVIDAHVPEADATLPDSDSDDSACAPSTAGKVDAADARAGRCSRTATTVRRTLCPGSCKSRIIYEQLKWAPIALAMLLAAVPLTTQDGVLDIVPFSMLFHGFYFVVSGCGGFALFSLLYPLPPVGRMVAVAVCSTIAYVLMIAAVMGTVSGVGLLFAVPACLLIIYVPFFSTMLHAAAVTCVVPVSPMVRDVPPSPWGALTGQLPVHTRKHPVVGPGAPPGPTPKFVFNADALLPLWRLFAAFGLIGVTYYWSQVYTRYLVYKLNEALHNHGVGDNSFGFATIMVYELVQLMLRRLMRTIANPRALVSLGIPDTSARALSLSLANTVVICGAFFSRLLFLKFSSVSAVAAAVAQRAVFHIVTDVLTMTRVYHRVRTAIILAVARGLCHWTPHIRSYKTFLTDQFTLHMYGHVANYTSLVAWALALLWLRFGYNSAAYPVNDASVPSDSFWLFLEYGGVLAVAELGELLLLRTIAACVGRSCYFDRSLRPMRHWAARVAFTAMAAHMLHDALVALVRLEPNNFKLAR